MNSWLEEIEKTEQFLLPLAEAGSIEAQISLGALLAHKCMELNDINYLNEAEIWYVKAVNQGSEYAQDYMKTIWPFLKESVIKRINQ